MKRLILTFLLALSVHWSLRGEEFFVSTEGSDSGKGSLNDPFKTIQKGVNALQAGDTLTILPGRYHEAVFWRFDGSPDQVTTVRARIPGTVLLCGDVPAAGFKAVPGKKNCYAVSWPRIPEGVNECDSFTVYKRNDMMMNSPHATYGSYSYDEKEKLLYISTSDGRAPEFHSITVSEIPSSGFYIAPKTRIRKVFNVVIDGLCARGFSQKAVTEHSSLWGFALWNGEKCVIRNCSSYLNEGGITLYDADGCRVENCRTYSNGSTKYVVGGNIALFSCKNSTIDKSLSFKSLTYGLHFYGKNFRNTISNSVSIGDFRGSIWIKVNEPESKLVNCYTPDLVACYQSANCVYHSNDYDRSGKGGPTSLALGKKHVTSFPDDFADPWNFDLRLQKNSRLKKGFPGENVYFVSSSGKDENDGRSVKSAWKTFKNVPRGATVYLLPGSYQGDLLLEADHVIVAGRGQHAPILIQGGRTGIAVKGKNVTLKRLNFSGQSESAVALSGDGITLEGCAFTRQKTCVAAPGKAEIHITHSAFGPAVSSIVAGDQVTGSFTHNISEKLPEKLLCVSNVSSPRRELSMDGLPYGPVFFLYLPQTLKKDYLTCRATSSTTAEIFWSMNANPAVCLFYAEKSSPRFELMTGYARDSFFHSISLKELKPETEYRFYLTFLPKMHYTVGSDYLPSDLNPEKIKRVSSKMFTFRTPAADTPPRTWYVSPAGNDQNPGNQEKPFRTIARAAIETIPGDTVIIGEGTYPECVFITSGGTAAKPITFKAAPRAEVWIKGFNRRYSRAFVLFGKEHLNFDGLRFKEYGTAYANASGVFLVFGGGNIRITRCMHDGRAPGYAPPILHVRNARNISLSQSVCIEGMSATVFLDTPNVEVTNNVFKKPSIWTVFSLNSTGKSTITFANNIMTDSIRAKTHQPMLGFSKAENFIERNNCYFMRLPRDLRKIVECTNPQGKSVHLTLDEYYKLKGEDGQSFFANPGIKVLATQLCWRNEAERQADLKKPILFQRNNVNMEDERNPEKITQYRHWNFKDFFAPELYRKHQIGLNDALFKDVSVEPRAGYDQR